MYRIFIVALAFTFIWGQDWTQLKVIEESQKPIYFQKHWRDESDDSVHVIYSVYTDNNKEALFYRKIFPSGTVSSAMEILPGQNHHSHSDITGAHDGKHVFMAVSIKRLDSEYDDIFFSESSNGGMLWSKFIPVPRQSITDATSRYYPNILYSEDRERLWIYYLVSTSEISPGSIRFVTRPKGSSIFSNEVVALDKRTLDSPLRVKLTEGGKSKGLHIAYKCYGMMYYEFSSDGISWTKSYCFQSYYQINDFDLAVHTNLPMGGYTLHGYKYNDKLGVRLFYSNNYYKSCLTGTYYYITDFLPDVFSNQICEYEEGEVFLSFGARNRFSVGETKGLIFLKNMALEEKCGFAKNPFKSEESLTFVTSPTLSCRFLPSKRGHVSLTAVGFSSNKDKYYLYLTDARITKDWVTKYSPAQTIP